MKPLTQRLRVLRAGSSLSQIETAARAGIKHYRYWRIESGYVEPTDSEIAALARVFNVQPAEISDAVLASR